MSSDYEIDNPPNTETRNPGSESVNLPFSNRKINKRSAIFWAQVGFATTAITIGTVFTATGLMSVNLFMPMLTGTVGYFLPAPKS